MDMVSFDFGGMLEHLTGYGGWREIDGPNSGSGLDYWYGAEVPGDGVPATRYQAYINLNQTDLSLSAYPLEADGTPNHDELEGWNRELDIDDLDGTGFENFVSGPPTPAP